MVLRMWQPRVPMHACTARPKGCLVLRTCCPYATASGRHVRSSSPVEMSRTERRPSPLPARQGRRFVGVQSDHAPRHRPGGATVLATQGSGLPCLHARPGRIVRLRPLCLGRAARRPTRRRQSTLRPDPCAPPSPPPPHPMRPHTLCNSGHCSGCKHTAQAGIPGMMSIATGPTCCSCWYTWLL